jgi:hypothetical protein
MRAQRRPKIRLPEFAENGNGMVERGEAVKIRRDFRTSPLPEFAKNGNRFGAVRR